MGHDRRDEGSKRTASQQPEVNDLQQADGTYPPSGAPLGSPPVVRDLLVVQMPNASDERGMAPAFCPLDRFPLGPERAEHMIGMIFHNVVIDACPLGPALIPHLDEENPFWRSSPCFAIRACG